MKLSEHDKQNCDIISKIIANYESLQLPDNSSLSGYIAIELGKIEKTKKDYELLLEEETEIEKRHKEERKQWKQKLIKLQNNCEHISTKYYPDASGNNDSSTFCNICHKEL